MARPNSVSVRRSFFVEMKDPDGTLTIEEAKARLKGTGMRLDTSYAPVHLGQDEWAVRAKGTEAQASKAHALPGVEVFADGSMLPIDPIILPQIPVQLAPDVNQPLREAREWLFEQAHEFLELTDPTMNPDVS